MGYVVDFDDQAQCDLKNLYDYVREKAGDRQARTLVANIYDYCLSFDTFPHRGTRRDDLMPGLRTVGQSIFRKSGYRFCERKCGNSKT